MSKFSEVPYLRAVSETETSRLSSPNDAEVVAVAAVRVLNELNQGMFDAVDDSLFELANNARSNNEQNRFFETMREVRIKRRKIETSFASKLKQLFSIEHLQDSKETKNEPSDSLTEPLSLVGDTDLELNVAITSMSSKAQANFQGQLLEIKNMFQELYGSALSDSGYPLEPKGVCTAFVEATTCLEVELKEKLLILKQFDRYVMSHYSSVLESASSKMKEMGIIPSPERRGHTSLTPSKDNSSAGKRTNKTENRDANDLYPAIQALLEQHRSFNSPSSHNQPDTQGHELSARDLLILLNQIQMHALAEIRDSEPVSTLDIRSTLSQRLKANKQPVSALDEDLINLVAMLFEFILEDYNLAPSMQVLISRLQIPVLRVVIQDKSFFSSNKHPARALLNTLARAGIGWSENQDKTKDSLYLKIEKTVHCVLDSFEGDISLFSKLLEDFNQFLGTEERRASIVEQRTREAEAGRVRTKQAHKKVEETLSRQILSAHHAIPTVVIDTLRNGWSRVMFLAFLKDETEHQWQSTVEVAKELIWCLQPLTTPKERQRWITVVPKLLKDLEAGLRNVSYNSSNLKETIEAVKQALTNSFKESSFAQQSPARKDRASKQLENDIREAQNRSTNKKQGKPLLAKYMKQVSNLKVGQWVEFKLLNDESYRCKLSAVIEEADTFIFVNRMGLKPIEKSRTELARDLQDKKVIFLEQGLVIDRALSTIAKNLRQTPKSS